MMKYTFADYQASAEAIRSRLEGRTPKVLMILGSGLGYLGDVVEDAVRIPYGEIPGFPVSTAPGHAGRLAVGRLAGKEIAVMQGRFHTYEGYSAEEVVYALRVLRLLGAETLIVTNASGAVNTSYHCGDIVLIKDHVKLFGFNPLEGPNLPEFGPRFPDASFLYTPALRALAKDCAAELGISLQEGVYMFFPGPSYETPAEIRAARILGADAVGMSTVPEVLAASHCGMKVLGFSLACNMAAGILDQPLSEQEVLDAAEAAKKSFSALVLKCLERL